MSWLRRIMFLASIWLVAHATSFAEDKVWFGTVSTDWFEPANWSPAGVPSAEDTALIYSNSVVLTADVAIHGIVLQRGTVDGPGNLIATNFSWSDGTVTGAGTMLIPSGGLLTADGPSPFKRMERNFVNAGTVKLTAGRMVVTGKLRNLGVFEVYTNSSIGGTLSVFENQGLFSKVEGSNTNEIGLAFLNTGEMRILSGTLLLTGVYTNSGSVDISDGATLEIRGFRSVLDAPCAFTGRGLLRVMATGVRVLSTNSIEATIQIGRDPVGNGDIFFDAPTRVHECILINGGIGGTNVVTITNFNWQAGLLAERGTIHIPTGGRAVITNALGLKRISYRTIINEGTIEWGDGVDVDWFGRSGVINNGLFDIYDDTGTLPSLRGIGAQIVNTGTLLKRGTGAVGAGVSNMGTVKIQGGTLVFSSFVQSSGQTLLDGGSIRAPWSFFGMDIRGGRVEGSGNIYGSEDFWWYGILSNGGDINPGAPIGRLNTGSFSQWENGRLNIEIGGTIPGVDFDCMIVNGEANLSGSLNLMLVNEFVPRLGDRFEILRIGNEVMSLPNRPIPREFTRINGTDLGNGLMFSPEYSPSNLVLTVVGAPSEAWYLTGVRTPLGGYRISFRGDGQTRYVIQASTMFSDWLDLFTNSSSSGLVYYDYDARNFPHRFYRLRAAD